MDKKVVVRLLSSVVALSVLMAAIGTRTSQPARADMWSPWGCAPTAQNYYVAWPPYAPSYLNGRGCLQFDQSGPNLWNVWADTAVNGSTMLYLYTGVSGQDRCGQGYAWNPEMSTYHYDSNTTYGTSGVVQGSYMTCMTGYHDYDVVTQNYAEQYYLSGYQGTTTDVVNP